MRVQTLGGVQLRRPIDGRGRELIGPEALAFVAELHRRFEPERRRLLELRRWRQDQLDAGADPLPWASGDGQAPREWSVPKAPLDLRDRRVEITGPVDRKMMINALNSGASVFMADFEDAFSPLWAHVVQGQANLVDAVQGDIEYEHPESGKSYRLGPSPATLVVRPRGWHLDEWHVLVEGRPVSASLFDFGLYLFLNHRRLQSRATGPYYYLPKLENAEEARLWSHVFSWSEDALGLRRSTIRATVLIETVLAALEAERVLYEIRDHASGLNAGRWDYIFSIVKKFRNRPEFCLPDRSQVTMDVPFMRAYAQRLVAVCHRHGAHALGGMSAFVPSRSDPDVNERALTQVRHDKERESRDGFDGTWVAHPDLVETARAVFDRALAGRANQLENLREDVDLDPRPLLDVRVPGGQLTEAGLRSNVDVGVRYLLAWLGGNGAAAIHNLMEDAATAEIARAQVWQWVRHGCRLDDGRLVSADLVQRILDETTQAVHAQTLGDEHARRLLLRARTLFDRVSRPPGFHEFLTLPAYEELLKHEPEVTTP